jgi:hypothetical protein
LVVAIRWVSSSDMTSSVMMALICIDLTGYIRATHNTAVIYCTADLPCVRVGGDGVAAL